MDKKLTDEEIGIADLIVSALKYGNLSNIESLKITFLDLIGRIESKLKFIVFQTDNGVLTVNNLTGAMAVK